jgi:GAF domain-containing protein
MPRKRGQPAVTPKPVALSEFFTSRPGAVVTRAQLYQVLVHMVERRILVEREIQRQGRWYNRLWRFLTSQPDLTAQQEQQAIEAAHDPAARQTHDAEPCEPEPEPETTESGVKVIDRRRGRE